MEKCVNDGVSAADKRKADNQTKIHSYWKYIKVQV